MTATRALIDVAGRISERELRVAVDSARRQGLVRVDRLARRAAALGNRPGAAAMRRLVASGQLAQESEGERALAGLFLPGDPLPCWQVWVLPGIRVDAAYLEARLVLEYDGRAWHTLDTDREADAARELKLEAANIAVVRVTAGMLRNARAETRRRILALYHQRCALGLAPIEPVQ